MEDPKVTLLKYEMYLGACAGVSRELKSRDSPQYNKVKNKEFGWHTNIEAACAEAATGKYYNIFWDGSVDTFKAPDVGEFQVRHTFHEHGDLIIYKSDDPKLFFILVTGKTPTFRIRGYILGKDGMVDKYWYPPKANYPAWFVPQGALRWVGELKAKIRAK